MRKILVIDDNKEFRETLQDMLQAEGYVAQIASNGMDGIQMHKETPFDLIITDILMPEKEGLELIMELKANYKQLPIIAISGAQPFLLDSAKEFGVNAVLQKPVNSDTLIRKIKEILDTNLVNRV